MINVGHLLILRVCNTTNPATKLVTGFIVLHFGKSRSKLRGTWSSRKGYYVADVLHAGNEQDQALKAQAKAGVRA